MLGGSSQKVCVVAVWLLALATAGSYGSNAHGTAHGANTNLGGTVGDASISDDRDGRKRRTLVKGGKGLPKGARSVTDDVFEAVYRQTASVQTPRLAIPPTTNVAGSFKLPAAVPKYGSIVAGEEADPGAYPWLAKVFLDDELLHFCGASLISDQWLVSAAHCFAATADEPAVLPENITAFVGMHFSDPDAPGLGFRVGVKTIFLHEGYDSTVVDNDIALLQLSAPVPSSYTPVEVSRDIIKYNDDLADQYATVAGWGSITEAAPDDDWVRPTFPDALQFGTIGLVNANDCAVAYGTRYIKYTNVCAMNSATNRVDPCQGDSGGPLFKSNQPTDELIGIVSWGLGCAALNRPGVYTAVAAYANWIETSITQIEASQGEEAAALYTEGGTKGGCQCELDWRLTSGAGCSSSTIYRYCGMSPPCDGDDGGVEGQSWCVISAESRNTAACIEGSAGDMWDYCGPAPAACSSPKDGKCALLRGGRPVAGDYLDIPTESHNPFN
jgi:hypothetical protein